MFAAVDSVARLIYRGCRSSRSDSSPPPIFITRPASKQRLCLFSFHANSFMHALSTYITDAAIGANYAEFIKRLTRLQHGVQERASPQTQINDSDGYDDTENHGAPLSDVFSIMDYHTSVMDRITEACFLKTRHRGVGGMSLVECMDAILRVGKLVVDLRTGRLAEDDGEPKLVKLVDRFGTCLNNLVRSPTSRPRLRLSWA